jgi:hypothetical protein
VTTKDILVALRNLLREPARHTQRVFARDAKNYPVPSTSQYAVCWCLAGGIAKITGDDLGRTGEYLAARDAIQAACGNKIAMFNDHATHKQVLEAIDKAVANAG